MVDRGPARIDWRAATRAGVVYTAGVFAIAFAVGAVRVTVLAPQMGATLAVILEAPVVLSASWLLSRWCTRRFKVSDDSRTRVLMGVVAFAVLMLLELGVSALAFGETLEHFLANYATAPGALGLAMQVCFAAIPWAQARLRGGIGRS